MSTTPFQKLLALVALDAAITAKRVERDAIQKLIDQEYHALDELEKLEQQHEQAVHDARKAVDVLELAMKTVQQRENKKKKLIDVANNLKEFNSAKAELATVQEDLLAQEEGLLVAWNSLEQAQKHLEAFNATYHSRIDGFQKTIAEYSKEFAQISSAIQEIEAEKPECQAKVPEEWLLQYNQMHASVAEPVAPFIDDACSVCFSPCPSQWAGRINKGAILPCKGCFRLLYSPSFHMRTVDR